MHSLLRSPDWLSRSYGMRYILPSLLSLIVCLFLATTGRSVASEPAAGPVARTGHAMCFFPPLDGFLLFGGKTDLGLLADTWLLRDKSWSRFDVPSPSARQGHSLTYDASRDSAILFGGLDGSNAFLAETWKFDGVGWNKLDSRTAPPERAFHTAEFDNATETILVFGGLGDVGLLSDTWTLEGVSWQEHATGERPTARKKHGMKYSARLRGVLAFGGYDPFLKRDTWLWKSGRWRLLSESTLWTIGGRVSLLGNATGDTVFQVGRRRKSSLDSLSYWNGSEWVSTPLDCGPDYREDGILSSSFTEIVLFGGEFRMGVKTNETWMWLIGDDGSIAESTCDLVFPVTGSSEE